MAQNKELDASHYPHKLLMICPLIKTLADSTAAVVVFTSSDLIVAGFNGIFFLS